MHLQRPRELSLLDYISRRLPPPRACATPEMIRRRRRIAVSLAVTLLLVICVIAPTLLGDNPRRVRIQHGGTRLPASTRNLTCGGCSLLLGGGVATASFSIAPSDLRAFLSQFQVQTSAEEPLYFSGPFPPDGIFNGMTPQGDDRVHVAWTSSRGEVKIDLSTDSN